MCSCVESAWRARVRWIHRSVPSRRCHWKTCDFPSTLPLSGSQSSGVDSGTASVSTNSLASTPMTSCGCSPRMRPSAGLTLRTTLPSSTAMPTGAPSNALRNRISLRRSASDASSASFISARTSRNCVAWFAQIARINAMPIQTIGASGPPSLTWAHPMPSAAAPTK